MHKKGADASDWTWIWRLVDLMIRLQKRSTLFSKFQERPPL